MYKKSCWNAAGLLLLHQSNCVSRAVTSYLILYVLLFSRLLDCCLVRVLLLCCGGIAVSVAGTAYVLYGRVAECGKVGGGVFVLIHGQYFPSVVTACGRRPHNGAQQQFS